MLDYAEPIVKLIDELKRLPGVGGKSAQRIAFHLLRTLRPGDIITHAYRGAGGLLDQGGKVIAEFLSLIHI